MDFKEIKKKTDNELKRILAEERGKLYDLRLRLSINQLKDVSRVKSIRANIARILMQLAKPKEESGSKKSKPDPAQQIAAGDQTTQE